MYFGWITKTTFFIALLLGVIALGLFLGLIRYEDTQIKVVFLSVGQGDAILIESGRQQILIDGGRHGDVLLAALGQEMPFYDHTIDVVIATHPDADHIGGFPLLFERYQVGEFIETGALETNDTAISKAVGEGVATHHILHTTPGRLGTNIELAQGGILTLLYPKALPLPDDLETNDGSIVSRFVFGDTSFLLTGDLPHEETFLPDVPATDILKVAHHGSHYSTSDAWLDLIHPKEAIISVGKNTYGHPAPEVMDRLRQRGITTYRTDTLGSIVYQCFAQQNRCVYQK